MQRRGWLFLQEVPNQPSGPPFTWHADRAGRIVLERVRVADGKEAWLFSKKTVRNIPAMYEQARSRPADMRFVRLGVALSPLTDGNDPSLGRKPPGVPSQPGVPAHLMQGFFRVMAAAEAHDSRLVDALDFLDLSAIPQADRRTQGTRIAGKLDAALRKLPLDLSALPDDWNASPQVLGESQGVRIEIVRQRDGCWRFSSNTVSQAPAFFDRLTARDKAERDRARPPRQRARDSFMTTFLIVHGQGRPCPGNAECLDLSHYRVGTHSEIGPVLAYKLKYVIDRIGRVYIQEVPDTPDGPRYVFYRGDLGRIVLARKSDGPRKAAAGCSLTTPCPGSNTCTWRSSSRCPPARTAMATWKPAQLLAGAGRFGSVPGPWGKGSPGPAGENAALPVAGYRAGRPGECPGALLADGGRLVQRLVTLILRRSGAAAFSRPCPSLLPG